LRSSKSNFAVWGLPRANTGRILPEDNNRRSSTCRIIYARIHSSISGGGQNRCAYLTNRTGSATLSGFTLRDGYADSGGALGALGGGAYGGTLNNCILIGNQAINPIYYLNSDAHGGGAYQCTLNNCILNNNSALNAFVLTGGGVGGGAYDSTLNNCTLTGNSADFGGGGAFYCTLNNCTLTGNTGYGYDGGASFCTQNNCISFSNYNPPDGCYDCGSGHLAGNNWFGDPLFAYAGDYLHLQSNSPCINAGNNASAVGGTDLDGNPRIAGGTVDIGAYEFQAPVSMISYAWLQQFNLPINNSIDTADPDGDGVDNYHEWLAGSDPINPLSSPAQLTITPSDTSVILTWSTNAVGFTLQSTTNLVSPAVWSTNSPAPVVIGGQNAVIDPVSGPQQFYRLVQ
jgi:hypothetical protein